MRKMKRLTSVFALLLVASLLVSNAEVLANSSDGKHYTYTYDCWDVDRESPDAYSVERVISGSDFKDCGNFSEPQGLFSTGNKMYVADTGMVLRMYLRQMMDKCTLPIPVIIKLFTWMQTAIW